MSSFTIQNDTLTLNEFNGSLPSGSLQKLGVGTSNPQYPLDVVGTSSFDNFADISNNIGDDSQVVNKVNNSPLWSYNDYSINISDFFPMDSTSTISGLSGTGKWSGGVLAPNGKIYCIPYDSTVVAIIDPISNTVDTTTITGLTGTGKWSGGVLASNDKIYCIPYNSTVVGIINTITNTIDTTTITGLDGTGKWSGGVLAPNRNIYCIRFNSIYSLYINPITNTTTRIYGIAGDNWLQSNNIPTLESSVNRIAWSPTLNLFVAVGQQGRGAVIWSSPDGKNWTARPTGITLSNVTQLNISNCNNFGTGNIITCTSTSNLVVGTYVSTSSVTTSSPQVINIIDGTTFETNTRITLSNTTLISNLMTCTSTVGLEVGMLVSLVSGTGSTGGRNVLQVNGLTSFNISTSRNYSGSTCYADKALYDIIWCSGLNLFIGGVSSVVSGNKQIISSSDGINWIYQTTPTATTGAYYGLAYSPSLNRVIAVGNTDIIYSNDGINWTYVASPSTNLIGFASAWSPTLNLFVCLFSTGIASEGFCITSPDGINWTKRVGPSNQILNWQTIVWSNELNMFCALASQVTTTSTPIAISYDGINWTLYGNIPFRSWRSMRWLSDQRMFVAVAGDSNSGAYSIDGINWFSFTISSSSSYRGIEYSPSLKRFVTAVNSGNLVFAYDAAEFQTYKWSGGVLAPNGNIYCIPYESPIVGIIDTITNGFNNTKITGLIEPVQYKYNKGALALNGNIYCSPWYSDNVLIIQPNITVTTPTITVANCSYTDTGKTFNCTTGSFLTQFTRGDAILITTTTRDRYTGYVDTVTSNTSLTFIYSLGVEIPITTISTIQKTRLADVTTLSGLGTSVTGKWSDTVLSQNGKIYLVPNDSSTVGIIDSSILNTINTTSILGLTGTGKWSDGVLAPNGKIYCIPFDSNLFLVIKTGLPLSFIF